MLALSLMLIATPSMHAVLLKCQSTVKRDLSNFGIITLLVRYKFILTHLLIEAYYILTIKSTLDIWKKEILSLSKSLECVNASYLPPNSSVN